MAQLAARLLLVQFVIRPPQQKKKKNPIINSDSYKDLLRANTQHNCCVIIGFLFGHFCRKFSLCLAVTWPKGAHALSRASVVLVPNTFVLVISSER